MPSSGRHTCIQALRPLVNRRSGGRYCMRLIQGLWANILAKGYIRVLRTCWCGTGENRWVWIWVLGDRLNQPTTGGQVFLVAVVLSRLVVRVAGALRPAQTASGKCFYNANMGFDSWRFFCYLMLDVEAIGHHMPLINQLMKIAKIQAMSRPRYLHN